MGRSIQWLIMACSGSHEQLIICLKTAEQSYDGRNVVSKNLMHGSGITRDEKEIFGRGGDIDV